MTIRFNSALQFAAEISGDRRLPSEPKIRVIRDIFGRIRFAINIQRDSYPVEAQNILISEAKKMGAFAAPNPLAFLDDFVDGVEIFGSKDWHNTIIPSVPRPDQITKYSEVEIMDRQIVGQEWLKTGELQGERTAKRIVFYGLKGGVGRSTALAMLAFELASEGKRILLLDFDLESPGLSGLLMPKDRMADFGLVDWFVESNVGQSDSLISDLVADSPLAENLSGSIRVACAMARDEQSYVEKLAHVYLDMPTKSGPVRFASRMVELVRKLEDIEKPDVVLIDSRAGVHDLAAISIGALADVALLFGSDTAQSWQGYEQLFGHWRRRPTVLKAIRERLHIVQAMFRPSEQEARARLFLEHSYDLFRENLYDSVEAEGEVEPDAFSFDLEDQDAPHFPLRIRWSERFLEFNPLLPVEKGGIEKAEIIAAFGTFFSEIKKMLFED